jgi:hypothetical protein
MFFFSLERSGAAHAERLLSKDLPWPVRLQDGQWSYDLLATSHGLGGLSD